MMQGHQYRACKLHTGRMVLWLSLFWDSKDLGSATDLPVCPWASYVTALCLSFPFEKGV